jgi:hypothetical protein
MATWMALNSESVFGIYNAEVRRRRAVRVTVSKTMQFRDRLEHLPESDSELENVSSLPQAKNFEQLCGDLEPDGPTLYLLYRILSKTSHAGPYTIDQYMTAAEPDPDDEGQPGDIDALHRLPLNPGIDPPLASFLAAASLVLAGRAVDFIDPARTRRSELRRAARTVGIRPS